MGGAWQWEVLGNEQLAKHSEEVLGNGNGAHANELDIDTQVALEASVQDAGHSRAFMGAIFMMELDHTVWPSTDTKLNDYDITCGSENLIQF